MKYEEIKTPIELMKFMDENIKYGVVSNDGKIYDDGTKKDWMKACTSSWSLSSPERLIKESYGHCWDQVELERDWFLNHGYEYKTFYIWFELPYNNPYSTHTYLVYKDQDKWYYFEHSDSSLRGIHEFNTLEEAVEYQRNIHISRNREKGLTDEELDRLKIYEYKTPKYGCNFYEFIDHILDNSSIYFEMNRGKHEKI